MHILNSIEADKDTLFILTKSTFCRQLRSITYRARLAGIIALIILAFINYSVPVLSHPNSEADHTIPVTPEAIVSNWTKDGSLLIYPAYRLQDGPRFLASFSILDEDGVPTPALFAIEHLSDSGRTLGWEPLEQPFFPNPRRPEWKSQRPEWRERMPIHVNGHFSHKLPQGRYQLYVQKGLEYEPVVLPFVVSESGARISVSLQRMVDMPELGWWSGDPHVHLDRMTQDENTDILSAAMAEDIHMTSILTMGDPKRIFFPQYAYGKDGNFQVDDYWLTTGQEEPRTSQQGHVILLGIKGLYRDRSNYLNYKNIVASAKADGAFAGIAHYTSMAPGSAVARSILAPDGFVDFVEVLGLPRGFEPGQYFNLLNSGYRVGVSGGSDFPWEAHIGDTRTYVSLEPGRALSPDSWNDALAAGRSFATQGPLLFFTVDNKSLGETVTKKRGDRLSVSGRVVTNAFYPSIKSVRVYFNGIILGQKSFPAETSGDEVILKLDFPVVEDGWLILVAEEHNGAAAITSPIYLKIGT